MGNTQNTETVFVIECQLLNWKVYMSGNSIGKQLDNSGKWMYFFKPADIDTIADLCRKSIEDEVVTNVKHTAIEYLTDSGVACFYIDGSDNEQHKTVLKYFLENNLIPRNKNGNYRNIAFKFDADTRQGSYGKDFSAKLKLSDFVNVTTGEFIK